MSEKFEELNSKWQMGYILIDTLKGWVALNNRKPGKGITPEEFQQITGIAYEE